MSDNWGQQEFHQLEQAFTQVKRRMDAEWAQTKDIPLNAMQARILIRLTEEGPQKASALAEQLSITAGAITGIADKLKELELLERERDLEDRRVVNLVITDKGRELVRRLIERRAEIMEKMFSGLSAGDVRELTRLFRQIAANMDGLSKR